MQIDSRMQMNELAQKLANILEDYRKDDSLNPKKENVLKWIAQFSAESQHVILEEMIHICEHRYLTEIDVNNFLVGLVANIELTKNSPMFWNDISLLEIQKNGNSQKVMNEKFKQILKEEVGIDVAVNDNSKKHFIHLDDFLFTGNRLRTDLSEWLKFAPYNTSLDIIYIGYYSSAQYYIKDKWLVQNNPKNVKVRFWKILILEDRASCQNTSNKLWPTDEIENEDVVKKFLQNKTGYKFRDKTQEVNHYCQKTLFSSETNRQMLEKEFTIAGLKIINSIQRENKWQPLGMSPFQGLGFGAMVFSYRNCPNNTPLAFWWGDWNDNKIWTPLFNRKTYDIPAIHFEL